MTIDLYNKDLADHVFTADSIIVDMGATNYIFNNRKWFTSIHDLHAPITMSSSNGGNAIATAIGTVFVPVARRNGATYMILKNALFCPTAPLNMLSIGRLLKEHNIVIDGDNDRLKIRKVEKEVAYITWHNNIAVLTKLDVPTPCLKNEMSYLAIPFMHQVKNI